MDLGKRAKRTLRVSERKLRALAYEVTVAEARERARIAAGLHDEIGQILTLVRLKLGELREAGLQGMAAGLVDEASALVGQAAQATRSTTFELSCPMLQQLGLQAAIESQGLRMEHVYGLRVEVEGDNPVLPLSEPVLGVVFRVVRELLFNVHKHACTSNAQVALRRLTGRLIIRVRDDGIGFQPRPMRSECSPRGGFGLYSAEMQIEAIGGCMVIDAQPGRGTCVVITLPLSSNE
jgi:signal transduction histidine kinase